MKQHSFGSLKPKLVFGGSLLIGRRHDTRPLCSRRSIHMTLKAQDLRQRFPGVDFTKVNNELSRTIGEKATKHSTKVYSMAIQSNHIHLSLRIRNRTTYKRFIRSVTAHIVRALSKLYGISLKGLFNLRPWTRIVEWGRAFRAVLSYIDLNRLEVELSNFFESRRRGLNKAPI